MGRWRMSICVVMSRVLGGLTARGRRVRNPVLQEGVNLCGVVDSVSWRPRKAYSRVSSRLQVRLSHWMNMLLISWLCRRLRSHCFMHLRRSREKYLYEGDLIGSTRLILSSNQLSTTTGLLCDGYHSYTKSSTSQLIWVVLQLKLKLTHRSRHIISRGTGWA